MNWNQNILKINNNVLIGDSDGLVVSFYSYWYLSTHNSLVIVWLILPTTLLWLGYHSSNRILASFLVDREVTDHSVQLFWMVVRQFPYIMHTVLFPPALFITVSLHYSLCDRACDLLMSPPPFIEESCSMAAENSCKEILLCCEQRLCF